MGFLRDPAHERARAELIVAITAARRRVHDLPPAWHPEYQGAYDALHAEINRLLGELVALSRP